MARPIAMVPAMKLLAPPRTLLLTLRFLRIALVDLHRRELLPERGDEVVLGLVLRALCLSRSSASRVVRVKLLLAEDLAALVAERRCTAACRLVLGGLPLRQLRQATARSPAARAGQRVHGVAKRQLWEGAWLRAWAADAHAVRATHGARAAAGDAGGGKAPYARE